MDERMRKIFAENLRKYMTINEKTQADLCRYMGISSATASDWYNGNKMPRADKLQSLANWLGIELSVLIGEKQPEEYYLDPETTRKTQKAYIDNRLLFEAIEGSRQEDIQMAIDLLNRLKETNRDG